MKTHGSRGRVGVVVGLAVVAGGLAGCQRPVGRTAYLPGAEPPASPTPTPDVVVYDGAPAFGYDVIAIVTASVQTQPFRGVDKAEQMAVDRLREQAGLAGADAVIITRRQVVEIDTGSDMDLPYDSPSREIVERDRTGQADVPGATRQTYRVSLEGEAVRVDEE